MERYARQTVLPELGMEGQHRLKEASVLCIGAGGLGSPALQYLVAAGIGHVGIIDDDRVDLSNLQRQTLFREEDQGRPKALAARNRLRNLNSDINITAYEGRFGAANAETLLSEYAIILDGTDNFASKFLINDACVKYGRPLIYGSILGFGAQVSVFWAGKGPCYRCLYPQLPPGHIPNCAEAGVIGAMAGIAGTVQALETVKMALGLEWCAEHALKPLLGRLWVLDARHMETRTLTLPPDEGCPACSQPRETIQLVDAPALCAASLSVTPEEAAAMRDAVFIDVREAHELLSGRIPGAIHIPLGILVTDERRLGAIPQDRPVVIYCQHGIRSQRGAGHLREKGYGRVTSLEGGIVRWKGELV